VKQQDEDVSEEFVAMIFCLKIYIVLLGYPEFGIQWENLHRKPMGFEVPSQFSLQSNESQILAKQSDGSGASERFVAQEERGFEMCQFLGRAETSRRMGWKLGPT